MTEFTRPIHPPRPIPTTNWRPRPKKYTFFEHVYGVARTAICLLQVAVFIVGYFLAYILMNMTIRCLPKLHHDAENEIYKYCLYVVGYWSWIADYNGVLIQAPSAINCCGLLVLLAVVECGDDLQQLILSRCGSVRDEDDDETATNGDDASAVQIGAKPEQNIIKPKYDSCGCDWSTVINCLESC